MNQEINSRCRTCFQKDQKMLTIHKPARRCVPKRTYLQLLRQFAEIEFSLERERYLPQQICVLCCRQLREMFAFVEQAQECNRKFLIMANKQKRLACLQERTIDLPAMELDKSIDIKVENGGDAFSNIENLETVEAVDVDEKEADDAEETMKDSIIIKNEANLEFLKDEFIEVTVVDNVEQMEADDGDNVADDIEEIHAANDDDDDNVVTDNEISAQNQTKDLTIDYSATSANIDTANLNDLPESSLPSDANIICPICKKLITRPYNLIKHMRIQHDIKDADRILEEQQVGPKERIFFCKLCSSKYTNKYEYLNHLMNQHGIYNKNTNRRQKVIVGNKIIQCRSCDYTANTYAALHYHTRSKHGTEEDKFKCQFCAYLCLKKYDLLLHIKNGHKELIKNLKIEREKGTGEENIKATRTLQDAIQKSSFVKHRIEHCEINPDENTASSNETTAQTVNASNNDEANDSSDDNLPLIQTVKQPKEFGFNVDLDMDKESSDDEFIRNILNIKKRQPKSVPTKYLARRCEECGNIYKNQQALYAHQRHVHIAEDKYSLCPHCGKKYKRKNDLKNHIEKAHTPKIESEIVNNKPPPKVREKRFMCTECSYICSTITILKIHMNRHHTGEKPYQCDVCYKSFIVPFDLKTHRYLHTGERPYKCPICSKGFRDNSHMIKHKRIHSGERPYKCKECGKGFTQSYNLSVHKRTHLRERQLNCPVCGKLFENKSLLNIHRINENHHDEVV